MMTEFLEMPQLVDQHRVPEVQVGRRRIEAGLDPKRPSRLDLFGQFGLNQQFVGTALDQRHLEFNIDHGLTRFDGRGFFATLARLYKPVRPSN